MSWVFWDIEEENKEKDSWKIYKKQLKILKKILSIEVWRGGFFLNEYVVFISLTFD